MNTKDCWMKDECNQIDCNSPSCIKLIKLDDLYTKACIPLIQRKDVKLQIIEGANECDIESFKKLKDIKLNITDFINFGKNLYLYSDKPGTGKTTWVLKLINSYFNKIWSTSNMECKVLFIHVPQFLLALKDNISEKSEYVEHIKENILTCDLVVFDELTTRAATNFELDNLLSFINTRLSYGKSCFYTSNVRPNELAGYLGDRLASRVINLSECIEFKGEDMRILGKENK